MLDNNIQNLDVLKKLSNDYRSNNDVASVVEALGMEIPQDMEVRVFCNTADTFYMTLPSDPSVLLQDNELMSIAGGNTASTAGSFGSAGTIPSTFSSASTIGCAGCAGGA